MATATEKSISFYQFLKWHEGILFFYLYNDKQKAIELLNEVMQIIKVNGSFFINRRIEVLGIVSGSSIFKTKNYEEAITIFNDALEFIENIPHVKQEGIHYREDHSWISSTLTELHYYQESLNYTLKGINICNSIESLYLYAELHLFNW